MHVLKLGERLISGLVLFLINQVLEPTSTEIKVSNSIYKIYNVFNTMYL